MVVSRDSSFSFGAEDLKIVCLPALSAASLGVESCEPRRIEPEPAFAAATFHAHYLMFHQRLGGDQENSKKGPISGGDQEVIYAIIVGKRCGLAGLKSAPYRDKNPRFGRGDPTGSGANGPDRSLQHFSSVGGVN